MFVQAHSSTPRPGLALRRARFPRMGDPGGRRRHRRRGGRGAWRRGGVGSDQPESRNGAGGRFRSPRKWHGLRGLRQRVCLCERRPRRELVAGGRARRLGAHRLPDGEPERSGGRVRLQAVGAPAVRGWRGELDDPGRGGDGHLPHGDRCKGPADDLRRRQRGHQQHRGGADALDRRRRDLGLDRPRSLRRRQRHRGRSGGSRHDPISAARASGAATTAAPAGPPPARRPIPWTAPGRSSSIRGCDGTGSVERSDDGGQTWTLSGVYAALGLGQSASMIPTPTCV